MTLLYNEAISRRTFIPTYESGVVFTSSYAPLFSLYATVELFGKSSCPLSETYG